MSSVVSNVKNVFFPEESYFSPEMKTVGYVLATALFAYSFYLSRVRSRVPASEDTTVVRDGPRTFEYISTSSKVLLDYRGGAPDEANDEFKHAMANAIKAFLNANDRPITHQFPETSTFSLVQKSAGLEKDQLDGSQGTIAHQIDKERHLYNLAISVQGDLRDSQWERIEQKLLDWRKAFSLTEEYFA